MNKNLTVFGAGNLGAEVAALWKSKFPDAKVFAITQTDQRHSDLKALDTIPLLASSEGLPTTPYVLFSVPPTPDYLDLVTQALKMWNQNGQFIFISSTSVYLENKTGWVKEQSDLNPESKLFPIEERVRNEKGSVLRLAGLYNHVSGPHHHLRKTMKIRSSKTSFLNLIHTSDAAHLAVQALLKGQCGFTYLGCDGSPLTKEEFAKWVLGEAQAQNVEYENSKDTGKRCQNQWTREVLEWKPKWPDFQSWMTDTLTDSE
ncbi:MAG TPA: hypothetical protein DCL41_04690 [Bdellovibrionales bacterium]|nr:hypothetical protein [Pseudobdellovibrionaceae bacterium]HAG91142.1 hypothetical protein [Bdellovibrionales bacterium]|tara:strand:+ start:5903 stop:6679 length:777 start_codon:yes stop_codon:yes gene_type:complete